MFQPDVPTHSINLQTAEAHRWAEVIACEKAVASRVVQEAAQAFERVPELLRWVFARLYKTRGGLYRGEIQAWADALGVSLGTATVLNCAYELSHLRWPKLFGCTAGGRWVDGLGMIHVRTLDWPIVSMGAATRVFRFHKGERAFVTIGVPGQVGVLSGMLPGAYSVTINWAPPAAFPSFDFGPTFLLRDTLETRDSYHAAVQTLAETRLSTSVFFTVCGTEPDQACVIERTQRDAIIRSLTGPALAQANHHLGARFVPYNADLHDVPLGEEDFSLEGSSRRADTLSAALAELPLPCSLEKAAEVLDVPTVLNPMTCQQMVFCPRTGDVRVWRRIDG
jgi:hypothetical protein